MEENYPVEEIREIVEKSFSKHFSRDEKIIYLGGIEEISHLAFIIIDSRSFDILVSFRVSSTGIYEVQLNVGGSWYLQHFINFREKIINDLREAKQ